MQDENRLNPAERELETALAALKPAAVSSSRAELLFRAGQRSGARRLWIWRGATLAAAAAIALVIFVRLAPTAPQRIVYVDRDRIVEKREIVPVAATGASVGEQHAIHIDAKDFRLRQRILRFGLDALPTQVSAAPMHESLDGAIGIPRTDLGVGGFLLRQFGQLKGGL